jgi:sec-independent protein translocase protein TatA
VFCTASESAQREERAMFGLGPTELTIIIIIGLLIFGAKRLPEIGKGLGGAIREFRNVKKDITQEKSHTGPERADAKETEKGPVPSLEANLTEKLLDQVPAVKKAMDIKKKADKIKEIVK